jgi:lysophospholipase L1-like esterase
MDMEGTHRRRRRASAILFGVGLAIVLFEVGGRIWLFAFAPTSQYSQYAPLAEVPERYQLYKGHPYFSYCLNEAYRSRDGLNRHNSLGYRGKEIERAKPEGVYRILCLGGSTTYETAVADYRLSFPDQMERILREQFGDRIEVVNAGCGGWNSWESLIDLEFRGLSLDPDLVVVYCGTNDVHPRLVPPEAYRRDNSGFRQAWRPDRGLLQHSLVFRRLGILLGWSRKNSVGSLTEVDYPEQDEAANLAANPPIHFADNLEHMVAVSRHHGADLLFSTWAWCESKGDYAARDYYQRGFREGNDVVRGVAERNDVELFDFVAVMPTDPEYWADGRHVNEQGARIKAELFAEAVAERFLRGREPASGQ